METRSDSLPETDTNRAACPKLGPARFLLTPAASGIRSVCALHSRFGDLQGVQEGYELLLLLSS
jgi:hypothetical protein